MLIKRVHDVPLDLEIETLTNEIIRNINFHRCIMDEFDFSYSVINNADFRSAELNGVKMCSSIIRNTKLVLVNGNNSNFVNCKFEKTFILHSNFKNSIFVDADLSGAIIKNSVFEGCDFRGANLSAHDFVDCNLNNALYNANTIWKEGFIPQKFGAIMEYE